MSEETYTEQCKRITEDYNIKLENCLYEWAEAWKAAQKKQDEDYADYIHEQLFSDNPEVFFLW